MRYRQRIDGEGFTVPNGQVTRWACCDLWGFGRPERSSGEGESEAEPTEPKTR